MQKLKLAINKLKFDYEKQEEDHRLQEMTMKIFESQLVIDPSEQQLVQERLEAPAQSLDEMTDFEKYQYF